MRLHEAFGTTIQDLLDALKSSVKKASDAVDALPDPSVGLDAPDTSQNDAGGDLPPEDEPEIAAPPGWDEEVPEDESETQEDDDIPEVPEYPQDVDAPEDDPETSEAPEGPVGSVFCPDPEIDFILQRLQAVLDPLQEMIEEISKAAKDPSASPELRQAAVDVIPLLSTAKGFVDLFDGGDVPCDSDSVFSLSKNIYDLVKSVQTRAYAVGKEVRGIWKAQGRKAPDPGFEV